MGLSHLTNISIIFPEPEEYSPSTLYTALQDSTKWRGLEDCIEHSYPNLETLNIQYHWHYTDPDEDEFSDADVEEYFRTQLARADSRGLLRIGRPDLLCNNIPIRKRRYECFARTLCHDPNHPIRVDIMDFRLPSIDYFSSGTPSRCTDSLFTAGVVKSKGEEILGVNSYMLKSHALSSPRIEVKSFWIVHTVTTLRMTLPWLGGVYLSSKGLKISGPIDSPLTRTLNLPIANAT